MDERRKNVSFDARYFENDSKCYNMQETFDHAHNINLWGSSETKSGEGSALAETKLFASELYNLLDTLSVKTLLDAPCGDCHWMDLQKPSIDQYIGVDILQNLIDQLKNLHLDTSSYRFLHTDITIDKLPKADLILCRDCLVHFSFEDTIKAVSNFKKSGSRYLLTSSFTASTENENIVTGDWQPLNLQRPPFCFPKPLALINEQCSQNNGLYKDKSLLLWQLSDL